MSRNGVRNLALSFLVIAVVWGVPSGGETPVIDRHARRIAPPSEGWTRESTVPQRKQGIWEVSRIAPDAEATPEQRRAANALVEGTFAAAKKHGWHDVEKAFADGWMRTKHDPHHFRNEAYLLDDRVLDPERPEFLMYYAHEGKPFLAGAMYLARTRTEHGEQIGGPLTLWHYHTWRRAQCAVDELLPRGWASPETGCAEGEPKYRSAEMLHVWLIERPKGPFSSGMIVTPEEMEVGLRKRLAERGF